MLLAVCLLAVLAGTKFSSPIWTADPTIGPDDRSGKIVIHAVQGDGCSQRRFDNMTGRTEIGVPCATPEVDASGQPIAKGTVGRLNQIGKSFLDR
jgi:hypothetical protein